MEEKRYTLDEARRVLAGLECFYSRSHSLDQVYADERLIRVECARCLKTWTVSDFFSATGPNA